MAAAHPTTGFDACVRNVGDDFAPCANSAEGGVGSEMMVKASVRPRHAGRRVAVWSLRPHADWQKVATVRLGSGGRARYSWIPDDSDVYNNTSWRFRMVLPGHGSSDTVRIRIRSDDF